MPNPLIVIMIDGVSADYALTERGRLPHLSGLAKRGFQVERLRAEVPGTSLPGRTSMLTGATADVSGVWGNKIWDGNEFRYASPDDVRVPTLPARAKAAGKSVAVLGFGMIRPEDADIFQGPWWVASMMQRARDAEPVPSSSSWLRVALHRNTHPDFVTVMEAAGLPTALPMPTGNPPAANDLAARLVGGAIGDMLMLSWVGALAASDHCPDLIIAESLMTDYAQHYSGYKSAAGHWSVQYADMQVGLVLERLRQAGKLDSVNIAVMSDHGHSPIEKAIRPDAIIPDVIHCSEGSLLHVVAKDADELARVAAALAEYGCERYTSDHVPAEFRDAVVTFVAPPLTSFETESPNPEKQPILPPTAISSHGLKPGMPGDDRLCIFAGPDVPNGVQQSATAAQIAPTFAALMGLDTRDFAAAPLFEVVQA